MGERDILQHRNWTVAELVDDGFQYYNCRKRVVMVRELATEEAPLVIETEWDTLVAEAGSMICFSPGDTMEEGLYDYEHWPVRRDYFDDLYEAWEEMPRELSATERHLVSLGCRPHFRKVGVWAKKLKQETVVQSPESPEPAVIPAGAWLCISAKGAAWGSPYSMDDRDFDSRYIPDPV
jgi:hypothetical protein